MSYSHGPRGRDDTCRESSHIQVGTYSQQGAFTWRPSGHTRAGGIEWEDFEGNHGQEVVNY
jgi:hypothetical protein